jgi:3'-5' exoribonuclease
MKAGYVRELEANKTFTTSFLVRSKEIREKKTGEPYLSLALCDRTGEIEAKMWDNVAGVMDTFDRDDFVKVKGLIQVYHNRPQLTIHKMRRLAETEIDFADYFPASARSSEEMWRELRQIIAEMTDAHLKALVEAVLDDPEIAPRFQRAPAAKQIHHAWLGGLLEHVLSLCQLCRAAAAHYRVDVNLMLAGAVLHDVGKTYELSYDRGFGYTTEGQLLGHMVIGLRIVGEKLRALPDFPTHLRTLVEHMIVSHHGRFEFGSPKLPQFPEALLLHYLDDMDSKMECMRALVEHDRQVDGHFTTYSTSLERTVLKKAKFMAVTIENGKIVTDGNAEDRKLPDDGTFEQEANHAPAAERKPAGSQPAPMAQPKLAPLEASHPLFAVPPLRET